MEFGWTLYHVLSRGDVQRDILSGDDDRRLFLDALGDNMTQRFELDLFAYVPTWLVGKMLRETPGKKAVSA